MPIPNDLYCLLIICAINTILLCILIFKENLLRNNGPNTKSQDKIKEIKEIEEIEFNYSDSENENNQENDIPIKANNQKPVKNTEEIDMDFEKIIKDYEEESEEEYEEESEEESEKKFYKNNIGNNTPAIISNNIDIAENEYIENDTDNEQEEIILKEIISNKLTKKRYS